MADKATLIECAEWHEKLIAKHRRAIAKAEEWSAENNDGDRTLCGTYYTDQLPAEILVHQQAARVFRRRASKASRPAEHPEEAKP